MNKLTTNLKSISLLQPTKFALTFNRLPNVVYFCQKCPIPASKVPPVVQQTPFRDRPAAGSKMEYDLFHIEFLLEETLESWYEVHRWMRDMATETGYQDYKDLNNLNLATTLGTQKFPNAYSDATLTVLNTQNIAKLRFTFKEVFPISLGSINFDSTTSDTTMHCEATFGFWYYTMDQVSG